LPLLPLLRESLPGVPVICDWHNIESELMRRYAETTPSLPRRLYAHRTASLIEKAEARLLISCEAHTVCSAREQATLAPAAQGRPVEVIGNGVDVEAFTRQPSSAPRTRILYVGSMDYHANIDAVTWFAREVWPLFLAAGHAPDNSKFTIVGRSPSPEVEALASLDRIEVTGTVPEVAPFYDQARAVVVPLRVGGGTRLKILEAMAAGVPVISTTLGAEGLDATAGTHYLRADTPQEFLEALAALTHERAASIASAARTLVEQQYDWPAIGNRLFDLHRRVAATSKR
jgi:glycosyltransferase involved in cell wall biosynthesis